MSKFNNKEWNDKLAAFIGYTHKEDDVIIRVEGVMECKTIYSKVEIVISEFEDNKSRFKYLGRVEPRLPEEWDKDKLNLWEGTIFWESENEGNFIYDWNPDEDWNHLMEVVSELGMVRVSANINDAYDDVCTAIDDYEER